MTTKVYALKDLDTSRLPPPVQEVMSKTWESRGDRPLTHIYGLSGPVYNEEKGTYYQPWVLSSGSMIKEGYWFCVATSTWISPPVEQFLEMIRIDKN